MKKKILILDNYDSFTYNLVQYFMELSTCKVVVKRNDEITVGEAGEYDIFVFSPGPGLPQDAGIMVDVVKRYAKEKKMLGVCLGHQAIGLAFGAELQNLKKVYHGVKTPIIIQDENDPIYSGMQKIIEVGRYHSWVIDPKTIPEELIITATSEKNTIQSIRHINYDIWGVQYHPESIMTTEGKRLIRNFLNLS